MTYSIQWRKSACTSTFTLSTLLKFIPLNTLDTHNLYIQRFKEFKRCRLHCFKWGEPKWILYFFKKIFKRNEVQIHVDFCHMIINSDKMHSSVTCNEMNVSYCAHAYIGLLDIAPSWRSKAPPPKKKMVVNRFNLFDIK